ncbi:zinc ABC transporter substrate-binding protein ZnuA [Testudinibacter sp. TR-2022]|uniref:zinc ABC transporter substrate-binding protein ZnuA n=1 Tax=Testudinibacter sp. TR-2022 TaxID=2585029 RepID=UPI0011196FCD|nr:zinc ABC transporter substrate-binding protein ZnuA [Testudinibacter sp. TR-2022]TNH03849.1 zinc ABC transporter substrate-binding protein ZnuA [Pasteurellaceae bacterium Phil31]TNH10452.1 zinc ABC transporter substrate-binding protein ZnuA [Testudinibacter sp. TR-2022]TNH10684.1 zinc ABC transporter substrate-binding protein ZnuA [Testudinibacter sp. TR-2022]TNH11352.1 zinc ABC transporter substrate-binding protein ZnuA [Testudinibacter sp. TR-2022]TNH19470.1 zinc ABC transporter substrate
MKIINKSLAGVLLTTIAYTAQAEIVTTVKPLGFIAAAVADGVTSTSVLLPTGASPHDYNMRPSDLQRLQQAELVVWVGQDLETFLSKSIGRLEPKKVLQIEKMDGIQQLLGEALHVHAEGDDHGHDHGHNHTHDHDGPPGLQDEHDHDHAHGHDHSHDHSHDHVHGHDHQHGGLQTDWHVWFSSDISEKIAEQIATRLSQNYPAKADLIQQNLVEFKQSISAKQQQLRKQLDPIKSKGYYVFHDAYGYFERQYGLNHLGSFTINPTVAPGAKKLNEIKADIEAHKAQCLFAEPQFTPRLLETLHKNTGVTLGVIDPMGEKIALSKTAYTDYLQSLADSFSQCLAK